MHDKAAPEVDDSSEADKPISKYRAYSQVKQSLILLMLRGIVLIASQIHSTNEIRAIETKGLESTSKLS